VSIYRLLYFCSVYNIQLYNLQTFTKGGVVVTYKSTNTLLNELTPHQTHNQRHQPHQSHLYVSFPYPYPQDLIFQFGVVLGPVGVGTPFVVEIGIHFYYYCFP